MAGKVILGISPGTRVMGLAVMHNGDLVESKVKSFKDAWSFAKQESILNMLAQMCKHHGVSVVCIKKVDPLRSSRQLDRLIKAIIRQSKEDSIAIYPFSLADLDYDAGKEKRQSRCTLSERVVSKHLVLKSRYLRERANRSDYYTKMFEAVALADYVGRDLI